MLARIEAASYPPLVLEVGATDAEGALAALAVALGEADVVKRTEGVGGSPLQLNSEPSTPGSLAFPCPSPSRFPLDWPYSSP